MSAKQLTIEYIVESLRETTGDPTVNENTTLADIEVDSVKMVEWGFHLEDEFDFEFDVADLGEIGDMSVGAIFAKVQQALAEAPDSPEP
jgi:acyl carrier protein